MLRKRVYPYSKSYSSKRVKYTPKTRVLTKSSYTRPAYRLPQRLHIETKCNDQPFSIEPVTTGGTAALAGQFTIDKSALLHFIKRETSSYGRVGNRVTLKSIHINAQLEFIGELVDDPNQSIRIIFFMDKKPEDTPPEAEQLLDLTGGPANNEIIPAFYAHRRLPNVTRFQILSDKKFARNTSGLALDSTDQQHRTAKDVNFNISANLRNYQAMYEEADVNGTYDKITQGAICMMVISDSILSPGQVKIKGSSRLRYTDM